MALNPEPQPETENSFGVQTIMNRFYSFVDGLDKQKRVTYGIVWTIIALVLMIVTSLNFGEALSWVAPLLGWPAGIILFGLAISIVRTTNLKNMQLFQFKDRVSPSNRVVPVLVGVAIAIVCVFFITDFLPRGFGGAFVILIALTAFNIIRRTPEEIDLAKKGLPDPRELQYELNDDIEEDKNYYYDDEGKDK